MSKKPAYDASKRKVKDPGAQAVNRSRGVDALRALEDKYIGLVEASLTGIYIDQDNKIVFANKRFAEIYGYSRDELIGMESWRLVHPEDRTLTNEIRQKRLKGEEAPSEYEARGLKKDNRTIWVKRRNCRIEFEGKPAILGNLEDVTQQKKMKRALEASTKRLRFLSSHLLSAQERERKRISIELHDELGQAMTVLKLQIRALERRLTENEKGLREDCGQILCYIDEMIENVRRLSRDLSPSILEDLGLSAALQWLVDDASKHYDVGAYVEMDDIEDLFSQESQIIIYRIIQESLANIGKHANASQVSVIVKKKNGKIAFSIEDDGSGFNLESIQEQPPTEKGLGLAAMDERVRMLKGTLEIWSQEGRGTKITFTVPPKDG